MEQIDELPCKTCIVFALCKAKGPFKKWTELNILWKSCDMFFEYLNYNCPTKYLLDNNRLYEALDLFHK
jgi:hypothetical protein